MLRSTPQGRLISRRVGAPPALPARADLALPVGWAKVQGRTVPNIDLLSRNLLSTEGTEKHERHGKEHRFSHTKPQSHEELF